MSAIVYSFKSDRQIACDFRESASALTRSSSWTRYVHSINNNRHVESPAGFPGDSREIPWKSGFPWNVQSETAESVCLLAGQDADGGGDEQPFPMRKSGSQPIQIGSCSNHTLGLDSE
jgi:hypothetical protein